MAGDTPPLPPPKDPAKHPSSSAKTASKTAAAAEKSAPVCARATRAAERARKREAATETATPVRAAPRRRKASDATEADSAQGVPEVVAENLAEESEGAVVAEETKGVAEESEGRAVLAEESEGVAMTEESEAWAVLAEESQGVAMAEAARAVVAEESEGVTIAEEAVAVPVKKARVRPPNLDPIEGRMFDNVVKHKPPSQDADEAIEAYYANKDNWGDNSGDNEVRAINVVNRLRGEGHLCLELKGEGINRYFFCTVCCVSATFNFTMANHFDTRDHKKALENVQYSMLPNATPWPFSDGHRFHNSTCYTDQNDVKTTDEEFEYCSDTFTVHTLGIGKIGFRRKPKDEGFHVISSWCEWLGTDVDDDIHCTHGILTFQYPSSTCPATRHCSICKFDFRDRSHVATIVNRETEALVCSDNFCQGKGPHIFHVSCLINWLLACEVEGLTWFCPNCRCTGWNHDEKPRITPLNFTSVTKLCRDGATAWSANCEPLENNSTGLFFDCPLDILEVEVEIASGAHVAFYKAIDRVTGTTAGVQ